MKNIFISLLLVLATSTFSQNLFAGNFDSKIKDTLKFEISLSFLQKILVDSISKKDFEKIIPIGSLITKTEKLSAYNSATDKMDKITYRYTYSSNYKNTFLDISIETKDDISPIINIMVTIHGSQSWFDKTTELSLNNYKYIDVLNLPIGKREIYKNDATSAHIFTNSTTPLIKISMYRK